MKILIPAAGSGDRLRPYTLEKPKPLISVAGKPIIAHILDNLEETKIKDALIIVGYRKEELTDYLKKNYSSKFNLTFVEQKERLGLAHSIYVAKEHLDDKLLITLGDEFFSNPYSEMLKESDLEKDAVISMGYKEIEDPRIYGVIDTFDQTNRLKYIEEKPENPKTNKAAAGVYVVKDIDIFNKSLEKVITSPPGKNNEYQLTDVLRNINKNYTITVFKIEDWYDCGRPDLLLKVNKLLLNKINNVPNQYPQKNSLISPPVYINKDACIKNSIIGPNVSISENTKIKDSIISNCIIGEYCTIENVNLEASVIGDYRTIVGNKQSFLV